MYQSRQQQQDLRQIIPVTCIPISHVMIRLIVQMTKYVLMAIAQVSIDKYKTLCVINDPLGQTHRSPASIDHPFPLIFVLFCDILKRGDGRTDTTCENSDNHRK